MRKELKHFNIGTSYCGNQEWFKEFMMRIGGCAAETACDCSVYLSLYKGENLYPFDINNLTREDYVKFGGIMKPYLHPRMSGIDRLSIYLDGFGKFLKDRGSKITLLGVEGDTDEAQARSILKSQIDKELPVPILVLYHNNPRMKDYEWHWFIINGYEEYEDVFMVKAVTYSSYEWLDFSELWDSGRAHKGGFIVINLN